jgi:hypothetical protein
MGGAGGPSGVAVGNPVKPDERDDDEPDAERRLVYANTGLCGSL